MLSKFQHVTADGKYVKSKKKSNDKLGYFTMVMSSALFIYLRDGQVTKRFIWCCSSCPAEVTW